jgi:hypothetical protein
MEMIETKKDEVLQPSLSNEYLCWIRDKDLREELPTIL